MIVLSCNNICKSFGINNIIEGLSITLNEKDKAGLVGVNGAGKSTLFKILAGEVTPDSGEIYVQKNKTIGYLPQEMALQSENTIMEEMLTVYKDVIDMENRIRELEIIISSKASIENPSEHESFMNEYSRLLDEFNLRNGYGYKSSIKGVLHGLGFDDEDFDKKIDVLSGGQKTRVALAKLLLKMPDILLLDEPTNHLDLEAVEWLESYLKDYKGCLFIISHDRFFLDVVVNKMFELDNHKIEEYSGNYSYYIKERELRRQNQLKQYELQQKEIRRQQEIIERFRSFNREKSVKQAESRQKALEKIEVIEKPNTEQKSAGITFNTRIKSGNDVLKVSNISKSFDGKKLFENISFEIKRGERVALIGPNGTGKTTLFKIINGLIHPDEGEFILGRNVIKGYYDQELKDLNDNKTVIDEVWDIYPELTQTRIRTILGTFLFSGDDVFKEIKLLSGGEKSRVALVKLMLSEANFLLLDEPTNHLDIISKEALENALLSYDGTIFAVSHDRYFLNKIATRILYLDSKNGITEYPGNYSYYLEKKARPTRFYELDENSDEMTKTAMRQEKKKQRELLLKEKQQKELIKAIEDEISSLEHELLKLHNLMCLEEIYSDPEKSQKIHEETKNIEIKLEELYEKWEQNIQE